MANVDTPFGLRPVRYASGAPYNGAANKYFVPASDDVPIFIGSLVIPAGGSDPRGVMAVTGNVSTGLDFLGVVVGVEASIGAGSRGRDSTIFREALTERYVTVADDPNLLFEIQSDGVLGPIVPANIGQAGDLTGFTLGSTFTGLSAMEVDTSSITGTPDGTEDVTVLGLVERDDNELDTNAKLLVRLNNHFLNT